MASDRLPLALFVEDREERVAWFARLLEQAGYAVLWERTGRHARERALLTQPELIVTAADLPDMKGVELCHAVRADPRITSATPIFVVFASPASREERLAALKAGAWECVAPPHDSDEIVLLVNAYVRAKLDADRMQAEGLVDPLTGLYNRQGLARRARELASQAFRDHGALACLVLALEAEGERVAADHEGSSIGRGARALQSAVRRSDVIGRLAAAEFAVVAPGTSAAGARQLAGRLLDSLQQALPPGLAPERAPRLGVRCGYDAVDNVGYTPIEAGMLLARAAAAVRTGRPEPGGRVRRFDDGQATLPASRATP